MTPTTLTSRGLSTRQAAELLGCSDRHLRRILAGERPCRWTPAEIRQRLGPELPKRSPLRKQAEGRRA
jgi:hypothetical protein